MNEPGSGVSSCRTTMESRSATWVPVAREATMSGAADSFSYAERTVPRATPSWAARSSQDGRRAPGASTPLSMAAVMPLRICSVSGVFADRSSCKFSGLVMPQWYTIFVTSWCFFIDQRRAFVGGKGERHHENTIHHRRGLRRCRHRHCDAFRGTWCRRKGHAALRTDDTQHSRQVADRRGRRLYAGGSIAFAHPREIGFHLWLCAVGRNRVAGE